MKKFFRTILREDEIGVFFAPPELDTLTIRDGMPVRDLSEFSFTLENGVYGPFMHVDIGGYLICEEFKRMLEENLSPDTPVEFIPMKIKSEEYGDRIYYIVHFTKIMDVLDKRRSKYIDGPAVIFPWLNGFYGYPVD